MVSFSDLFNPSFLMFLGILVLSLSVLVIYFESKIRDQNHKISSMLSVVSSLAEELNGVKYGLNHLSLTGGSDIRNNTVNQPSHLEQTQMFFNRNNLITVSDDEASENDSENDNEIDDDELSEVDDFDNESNGSSEIDDLSIDNFIDVNNDIKFLNLNVSSNTFDIDETDEVSVADSVSSKNSSLNGIYSENILSLPNDDIKEESQPNLSENTSLDLKTININLEEHIESIDYKKCSLTKLRSIISEKGLFSGDISKLKKPELLKLLGLE